MLQWEEAEEVILGTAEASGSALAENEAYLNSIEGKLNQLSAAFEGLASSTIDSDFVKGIVDMGTSIVTLLDNLGGLVPVITAITTGYIGYNLALSKTVAAISAKITAQKADTIATTMATAATKAAALAEQAEAKWTATGSVIDEQAAISLAAKASASKAAAVSAAEHATAMHIQASAAKTTAGAVTGLKIALGSLMIVATAAILVFQAVQTAKAKEAELRQQAIDDAKAETDAIDDLYQSYKDLSIITERTTLEEQKLESAFETLTGTVYEYKDAIDDVNESLEETIEYTSEATAAALQAVLEQKKLAAAALSGGADEAKDKLNSSSFWTNEASAGRLNSIWAGGYTDDQQEAVDALLNAGFKNSNGKFELNTDTMYETQDALQQAVSDLTDLDTAGKLDSYGKEVLSSLAAQLNTINSEIKTLETTIDEYDQLMDEINFMNADTNQLLTDITDKYVEFMTSDWEGKSTLYTEMMEQIEELNELAGDNENLQELKDLLIGDIEDALDAWYNYDRVLSSLDDTLAGIYDRKEEWEAEQEALEKELELQEKILAVEEAREALAKAKEQRVRVYRAGQGFVYETDWTQLQDAQNAYDEAVNELDTYKESLQFDEEIEALEKLYDQWESLMLNNSDTFQEWMASQDYELDKLVDNYEDAFDRIQGIIDDYLETGGTLESEDDLDLFGITGTKVNDVVEDVEISPSNSTTSRSTLGDILDSSASNKRISGLMSSMLDDLFSKIGISASDIITNSSDNETINIGNITLPNVSNATDFVNELKNISLQALSFMTSRIK